MTFDSAHIDVPIDFGFFIHDAQKTSRLRVLYYFVFYIRIQFYAFYLLLRFRRYSLLMLFMRKHTTNSEKYLEMNVFYIENYVNEIKSCKCIVPKIDFDFTNKPEQRKFNSVCIFFGDLQSDIFLSTTHYIFSIVISVCFLCPLRIEHGNNIRGKKLHIFYILKTNIIFTLYVLVCKV